MAEITYDRKHAIYAAILGEFGGLGATKTAAKAAAKAARIVL